MFFTVTMPVYNVKDYLSEAVESVLAQAEEDYELLLVDDGSTDGSGELCDRYAAAHPDRIRVVHTENQGPLQARRTGIFEAAGDYIYIMDSDDKLIDREALSKIKNVFQESGCDLVFFQATRDEKSREPFCPYPFKDREVFTGTGKEQLYRLCIKASSAPMGYLWNKVFSRALIHGQEEHEYEKDSRTMVMFEDLLQGLLIVTNAGKCVFLNEVFYYYRPTRESLTRKWTPYFYTSAKRCMSRLENFLSVWNITEEDDRNLLLLQCLIECVHCAQKISYCRRGERREAIAYLKTIAEDAFFRDSYRCIKRLPGLKQKLYAFLLYHYKYRALWDIIWGEKFIKKLQIV